MTVAEILKSALDSLRESGTAAGLAAAHRRVQAALRKTRKQDDDGEVGILARSYAEAMRIWDEQKAQGVSREERLAGLERTLRAAWPHTREWSYLCETCRDYGLEMHTCPGDATCGRMKPHLPHEYGVPCRCLAGKRYQPAAKPSPEDFSDAGKTKGFTRAGRR